jgi:hypothetical protein
LENSDRAPRGRVEEAAIQLHLWLLPADSAELEDRLALRHLVDSEIGRAAVPMIGELSKEQRSTPGEVGDLVVTLGTSVGTLGSAVGVLRRWLARRPRHTIRLAIDGDTVEISGLSTYNEDRLVDLYVRRHGGP